MRQSDMQAEFDKIASSEDFESWHRGVISGSGFSPNFFYEYKVKEVLRVLTKYNIKLPQSILDFGCGMGGTAPYLRKYFPNAEIHGVDISEELIKTAKEKQAAYNIKYAALKHVDGVAKIPFDMQFDLVFISQVFHHMPREEHFNALMACKDCMIPNGFIFVFDLNPYNPASRIVFNKHDKSLDKNANLIYPTYLKRQMKQCGFRISRLNYTLFFPKFLSIFAPLERYMSWIPMGAHYYLMCEKIQLTD